MFLHSQIIERANSFLQANLRDRQPTALNVHRAPASVTCTERTDTFARSAVVEYDDKNFICLLLELQKKPRLQWAGNHS